VGPTPSRHDRDSLSCGRIDGVEAVWHRIDAIDALTKSSSSFSALSQHIWSSVLTDSSMHSSSESSRPFHRVSRCKNLYRVYIR
jgi:hypothetical protein